MTLNEALHRQVTALLEELQKLALLTGARIACAESCTGGLLGAALSELSGSSAYFWGGMIAYANNAKIELLGVTKETIDTWGAVSEQCAMEMASGALRRSGVEIAIATTGIAGPGGGSLAKPVGLVWIALASGGQVRAKAFQFKGNREGIRQATVLCALQLIRDELDLLHQLQDRGR